MCGIGGSITDPGTSPDRDALERMVDALSHRGPDDRGLEVCGSVGFVHTRLAIVDPGPTGRQPMRDASGRWLLTYNGEIYNHRDLRRELPGPFRGGSDTETLVEAIAHWGPDAVSRCNGIFAFAALDTHKNRLFLMRDHLGIKPLYVYESSDAVWFASEIRALLAAGVPRRVKPDVLAEMILSGSWTWDTPIDGVTLVPPGAVAEFDTRTRTRSDRKWYEPGSAADAELAAEFARSTDDQLTERLATELQHAVRRQLMADVPVGVMCSGGLDSSTITALAASESPRVTAYNASVAGDLANESRYAERLAQSLGIDIRTARVTVDDWRAALVPSVRTFEYARAGLVMVTIGLIAELARKDGVKVLLTGEGSDELFGGYAFNHWRDTRAVLPFGQYVRLGLDYARSDGRFLLAQRLRARRRRGGDLRRTIAPRGLTPTARPDETMAAGADAYAHLPAPERRLAAAMLQDLYHGALPPLLNRQDKNVMASSVEARVPYLDLEVMRFVQNIPLRERITPPPKRLLRRVARPLLPAVITRRPKKLSMAVDTRDFIDCAARPAFIERGRIREIFGVPSQTWSEMIPRLSRSGRNSLWSGEIWCRSFLDDDSVERIESELWA